MTRFPLLVALAMILTACTTDPVSIPDPTTPTQTTALGTSTSSSSTSSSTSTSLVLARSGYACWTSDPVGGDGSLVFTDVTGTVGLVEPLIGMRGHTAIWSEVNGDHRPDLYVGTFADDDPETYEARGAEGPSPDRLLINGEQGFAAEETLPETYSRSAGGVGADLDSDGDLDMVVSRNTEEPEPGQAPTQILENVDGTLRVVEDSGIPRALGGRSVGVLDHDQNGLVDLFIAEDRHAGGTSVLFRNDGDLHFTDVTSEAGIPAGVHGLGVAIADFDGDTLHDIFVSGSNRMFLSDGPGGFVEADSSVFAWEIHGEEDDVAGASVADVNRDGRLDLAVGHHYNSTVEDGETVSVRLYLNEGHGEFIDVTEAAGLTPLSTKAPHVELNDFDNDGWPDLLTSASADDGPAVFVHEGLDGDLPRFSTPKGIGDPQYWVAAPSTDYDLDGRLDIFLLEWEPSLPSIMLRNETAAGNWLQVSVDAANGFGIGWRVEVLDGGGLVGAREITVTQGYSAGVMPVAHFGLGDLTSVDVLLTPPGGADPIRLQAVAANQRIRWPEGCG